MSVYTSTVDPQIEGRSAHIQSVNSDRMLRGAMAVGASGESSRPLASPIAPADAPPDVNQEYEADRRQQNRASQAESGHKALVQQIYDEIINRGNVALANEVVAADFVDHVPYLFPDQPVRGPAALTWVVSSFRTAFPDLRASVEDAVVAGDTVWVRSVWSGTHQGEFVGIVPTGRRINVQVIEIARVADGKIVEHWAEMDLLGMLKQLDLMPEPIGTPG
jgi:predicted ester cyclase